MTMLASPPLPAFHVYGEPRLLAGATGGAPVNLGLHRSLHGRLPLRRRDWLSAALTNVNLRGRGGADFPVAVKFDGMPSGSRLSVLVNGSEGEPASRKDRVVMRNAPHLILDGAMVVAHALGTRRISVVIQDAAAYAAVVGALHERDDCFTVSVTRAEHGFVGGEIRAVINGVNGEAPVPGGRRVLPVHKGINQRPTFASNVETFAHIALLAARGTSEFARVGSTEEPGTTLITLIGDVRYPGVAEVPTGVPLSAFIGADKTGPVLVGGYHGTWVSSSEGLVLTRGRLKEAGVPLNAGVIATPFARMCPIDEIVRVARWLAGETLGQCGPCFFGLPAIADDLARIADGGGTGALEALTRHLDVVSGRGACAHPDGSVQFVRSALHTFHNHFAEHAYDGPCTLSPSAVLPLPGEIG